MPAASISSNGISTTAAAFTRITQAVVVNLHQSTATTHSRHGLIIEWDGFAPSIAASLELLKVDGAKSEIEMGAALSSSAPMGQQPALEKETMRALGGLVGLVVSLTSRCGGTDERRGQTVLERQEGPRSSGAAGSGKVGAATDGLAWALPRFG